MAKVKKKPASEDYELDGVRHLNLSDDAIIAHKRSRRFMHNLELAVVIGALTIGTVTAAVYGKYHAVQYFNQPSSPNYNRFASTPDNPPLSDSSKENPSYNPSDI